MNNVMATVEAYGVLPVIRIPRAGLAAPLARALRRGGLPLMEVTLRTADAVDSIAAVKRAEPGMVVGAGTVLSDHQADAALDAGADFIVSPGFSRRLTDFCRTRNVPYFPGCSTAAEIQQGIEQGLSVFKFFPSELMGGMNAIRQFSGPFQRARFIPTSGITFDNLRAYLSSEAILAVGGSFVADAAAVKAENWGAVEESCRRACRLSLGLGVQAVSFAEGGLPKGLAAVRELAPELGLAAGTGGKCLTLRTLSLKRTLAFLRARGVETDVLRTPKGALQSLSLRESVDGLTVRFVNEGSE